MYIGKQLIKWAWELGRVLAGRRIGDMPNVFEYTDHKAFLHDAYLARKDLEPSFSHRYICNRLKVKSVAVFQHYVNGKVRIADNHLTQLVSIFRLNKKEGEYFELLVKFNQAVDGEEKRDRLSELTGFLRTNKNLVKPHQYAYYEQWFHSAIRAILSYHDFHGNPDELASMLNPAITATQARNSLRLLKDLGITEEDTDGFPRPTDKIITTGDQASHVAISNMLLQTMDLAKTAVDSIPRDKREMSSITLSLSEETFHQVQKEIAKCRYRVLELVRKDPHPDRVYQANFQLFPITKEKKTAS